MSKRIKTQVRFSRSIVLSLAVAAGASAVLAQAPVTSQKLTRSQPRFEAADVHFSPSARNPYNYASGGVLRGERYDLRKATMLDLIKTATIGYNRNIGSINDGAPRTRQWNDSGVGPFAGTTTFGFLY